MQIQITEGLRVLGTFERNSDGTWRDKEWGEYKLSVENLLTEIEATITGKEIG